MAEYRLTPAAQRDLESIWRFTADAWGIEQAERYIDLLVVAMQGLADAPTTAPRCDHIRAGYRRWHVERHVVYFRVTDYGIAVVRILHERMDAPRHL